MEQPALLESPTPSPRLLGPGPQADRDLGRDTVELTPAGIGLPVSARRSTRGHATALLATARLIGIVQAKVPIPGQTEVLAGSGCRYRRHRPRSPRSTGSVGVASPQPTTGRTPGRSGDGSDSTDLGRR